eukprot:2603117-Prymnesium_polylepis.1
MRVCGCASTDTAPVQQYSSDSAQRYSRYSTDTRATPPFQKYSARHSTDTSQIQRDTADTVYRRGSVCTPRTHPWPRMDADGTGCRRTRTDADGRGRDADATRTDADGRGRTRTRRGRTRTDGRTDGRMGRTGPIGICRNRWSDLHFAPQVTHSVDRDYSHTRARRAITFTETSQA